MIGKKDNLKVVSEKYPEIGEVLAEHGLHCVGCHASAVESIEEGCKAHGMDDNAIKALVKKLNERKKMFDSLPELKLTKKAVKKLEEKMKKTNAKYVRVFPVFGGFDFETTEKKLSGELLLKKEVPLLLNGKIERFLRGVEIDFSEKQNDFSAKRVTK